MYETSDFRKGLKIEINGQPYDIVEFQHVKPGKGNAFTRTRIKNLLTGNTLEMTFKSGEKVGKPDLANREMQYLYVQDGNYYFMDNENYEQIFVPREVLGEAADFMQENILVQVLIYNGKPIAVELPVFVILKVVQTDPGFKGDTATNASKPATLETGAKINVPLFVNEGDVLKIDTRSWEYVERVK
ncbi:MAG: Elongation factor P [Myxococcota bacterium]|nr:Elongation factor P [Myxococcota bacterium]